MLKNLILFTSLILALSTTYHTLEAADWDDYYENTLNISTPHKTLSLAHKFFEQEKKENCTAVDLGAGTGRDTLFLLNRGWQVLALDAEQSSIDIILNRLTDSPYLQNLETMVAPFSDMVLPNGIDLVNASYSLPFCNPKDFDPCWTTIVEQLAVGGRFSGHFFGENDDWANNPNLTIHSNEAILNLFKDRFVVEYLLIEDDQAPCANGQVKHWHVYHIVAKKVW